MCYLNFLCKRGTIDKNVFYNSLTDLIFRKILKDTSTCVDVGCHRGSILQIMMKYSANGKFFAFEPLPQQYKYLQEIYGNSKGVSVYNIALSDIAGESSFNYVISNPEYSGLIKRSYDRPTEEDTQITVKTDLMDNLLTDVKIDLIKVDVEGAELQVFRGAKELIKRDKPAIIFEHGLGAADCYGTTPEDVYDLLNGYCGLDINLLDGFLVKKQPLSKSAFCEQFYKGLNYYFMAYKN